MSGIDPSPEAADWLRLYRAMEDADLAPRYRADAERIWRVCGIAAALNYVATMRELEEVTGE